MCFTASPFLVLKVVGGVVGVVLGCARCARRVRVCDFSLISASGRCSYCCSIIQEGISRQEQKTKLKNSLMQPRTSQKKFSFFENALRALRAFPKGKKHQKLRTLGYPPFMEKLIQGQPGRGGPSHLRKSMKITNLTGFFSRKKHVKQVIFIDFLRCLGHPLAGFSCNYKVSQAEVAPAT